MAEKWHKVIGTRARSVAEYIGAVDGRDEEDK